MPQIITDITAKAASNAILVACITPQLAAETAAAAAGRQAAKLSEEAGKSLVEMAAEAGKAAQQAALAAGMSQPEQPALQQRIPVDHQMQMQR